MTRSIKRLQEKAKNKQATGTHLEEQEKRIKQIGEFLEDLTKQGSKNTQRYNETKVLVLIDALLEAKVITVDQMKVSDKKVRNQYIEMIEKSFDAQNGTESVDRSAAKGDIVVISLKGTVDNKYHAAVNTPKMFLKSLGSGETIPDIEQVLVGMLPGDTKHLSLQIPPLLARLGLAGKDAEIDVTLVAVKQKIQPKAS